VVVATHIQRLDNPINDKGLVRIMLRTGHRRSYRSSTLSLEERLCRWFPTTISKLALAVGTVILAALIMPG
jgi:hypothetical protein